LPRRHCIPTLRPKPTGNLSQLDTSRKLFSILVSLRTL